MGYRRTVDVRWQLERVQCEFQRFQFFTRIILCRSSDGYVYVLQKQNSSCLAGRKYSADSQIFLYELLFNNIDCISIPYCQKSVSMYPIEMLVLEQYPHSYLATLIMNETRPLYASCQLLMSIDISRVPGNTRIKL